MTRDEDSAIPSIAHALLMGVGAYPSPEEFAAAILKRLRHDGFQIARPDLEFSLMRGNEVRVLRERIELLEDLLKRAMEHGVSGADCYHASRAYELGFEIRRALGIVA